jgi:hypothetical protein
MSVGTGSDYKKKIARRAAEHAETRKRVEMMAFSPPLRASASLRENLWRF